LLIALMVRCLFPPLLLRRLVDDRLLGFSPPS
jgi:hypothetical protein